jgi:tetratricopeptide (TPR) repeat protein
LQNAQLNDAIIQQIKQFSHLHTLTFELVNLNDTILASLAHLPCLETLNLKDCDFITDEGLASFLKAKPETLQKITIHGCTNISEKGLALLQNDLSIREFDSVPTEKENWNFDRLTSFLDVYPTHIQILSYLAEYSSARGMGVLIKAKERLKIAIEREPLQFLHWKWLGFVYFNSREWQQSFQAYQHALELGMNQQEFDEVTGPIQTALNQGHI